MSRRIFVYELPYSVRTNLCRLLDAIDKWEELGGEHMGFDYTYLQYIRRKPSPTDELLTCWGNQNHTVKELFVLLSKMQFYRAMILLKDLVDEQYHHLLKEGEELMNQPTNKNLAEGGSQTNQRPDFGEPTCALREPLPQQHLQRQLPIAASNRFQDNKDLGLNLDNLNLVENKGVKKTIHEVKINNVPNARHEQVVDQNSNVQNNFSSQSQAAYNPNYNPNLNPPAEASDMQKLGQQRKLSNVSLASSVMEGCTPQISYEELEAATNGWDTGCILGRGGFGTVYKGIWKNTLVAIKKLEPQRDQQMQTEEMNASQMTEVLRELKHLNSHRHDNILSLYGYSVTENASCLVYQYMANGSLEDRLHCRNNTMPLNWVQRLNVMTGTARGIQFLHSLGKKPLVHGDIKSANILLDSNFEPRLGDFGLAREGPHQQYTHLKVSRVHGTKPYLPDEFLRARQFSVRVDTYSFGVVLFEVATGLRAYDENRKERFLKDYIVAYQGNLSALADSRAGPDYCMSAAGLLTLGRSCVVTRPKDRPDMTTVLADVQMLYNNYKSAERIKCLARQRSLTPTNPLEMQALHDEMRHPSPPAPSPFPLQLFINTQGQQQLLIPAGLSLEEAQRITKATVQLIPGSLGAMIVQSPPAVTVQPPSSRQPSMTAPSQIDQVYSPPPLESGDIPLLTALGVKEETEDTLESRSTLLRPAVSPQATSTQISSGSIAISTGYQSGAASVISVAEEPQSRNQPEAASVIRVAEEPQSRNQPEAVVNYSDFTVSLPEENQSAYLPRLPDLLGS